MSSDVHLILEAIPHGISFVLDIGGSQGMLRLELLHASKTA
jgi:hypothetical protein